ETSDDPNLKAGPLGALAELYRQQEKKSEAESLFKKALALCPKDPEPQWLAGLAGLYCEKEKYDEAERMGNEFAASCQKYQGQVLCTPNAFTLLTQIHMRRKEYAKAERDYRHVLNYLEQKYGHNHPEFAAGLDLMAEIYDAEGKRGEAQ